MSAPQIVVTNLSKTYRVPERQPGLKATLQSFFKRTYQEVPAVQEISFAIEAGEVVGFIGPNGAVPTAELKRRIDELAMMLDVTALLTKPARNLSLGERMKCELIASLLHYPSVLFLDEPTLGLDVSTQRRLREFIGEYNRRTGATIILTSHYMADVEALCSRLMVIHQGQLLYDGPLAQLVHRIAPFKLIQLTLDSERANEIPTLPAGVETIEQAGEQLTLRANRNSVAAVTAQLLNTLPILVCRLAADGAGGSLFAALGLCWAGLLESRLSLWLGL